MGSSGIGILFRNSNPFWVVTSKPEVTRNPFNYFCAPNGATPDYVAANTVRDFIGYAFICCYEAVLPENFTMWNMVEANDVQWMRENFLRILEKLVLNLYCGAIEIPTPENDFDHGEWSESINIGNADDGDEEEFMFDWTPGPVHEDAFAIVLRSVLLKGEGTGGDDEVIWLSHDALKDRAAVKAAIEEARKINDFPDCPAISLDGDWGKAIVAQPTE